MNTSSTHNGCTADDTPSTRTDREPVGIWLSGEDGDATTVELLGTDGMVTTLVQHPDGTIEIRTAAMSEAGQAVRVPPNGSAHTIDR